MKQLGNSRLTPAALSLSLLLASGCGGGGSDSEASFVGDTSSGASVVSRGIVTGFGSVYVNGVRYHTGGTKFTIDDGEGDESDLKVGMIVTVTGSSQGGGEGSADSIVYDNDLKGPVSAITPDAGGDASRKTLTILGQAVLVTTDTTIDDDHGLSFDSIALNDVLEVSGYVTATGFTATHIELQTSPFEIELKGHIDNLTTNSFTINGFSVSYDIGTVIVDDIAALAEGIFVEVKGQLDVPITGTILIARKIEGEDEGLDDDVDEAEIKGVISAFNATDKTFLLLGQKIDASSARLEPVSLLLADGIIVEAEGRMSEGVLIAHKVEQKGRKIKIDATLSGVDTGVGTVSFNFNGKDITIRVHAGTQIEDDNTGDDLLLSALSAGNFIEMEAFGEGPGVINAVEIERADPDEIHIVAQLEDFDKDTRSVLLLGVTFDLSTVTEFKDRFDNVISGGEFFDALVVGAFIKIKDTDSNAVFDKAELDD